MARSPRIGEFAPDFTLPSTHGTINLQQYIESNGPVLLVFYPRDATLICTRQLCNYRDNISMFAGFGVDLIAINDDSLESHFAFAKKYDFPFPLASDGDRSTCRAYDAFGEPFQVRRSMTLIGEDGRIWWRDSQFALFRRRASELREVISELKLTQVA